MELPYSCTSRYTKYKLHTARYFEGNNIRTTNKLLDKFTKSTGFTVVLNERIFRKQTFMHYEQTWQNTVKVRYYQSSRKFHQ